MSSTQHGDPVGDGMSGPDRSDAELLTAVRGGDEHAYGVLWDRHELAARRLAAQVAPPSEIDDLVSESFARVLRSIRQGGGPDAAFRPYLLSTLRRTSIDVGRSYRTRIVLTDDESDLDGESPSSPGELVDDQVQQQAALAAWKSLPAESQTLLWHLLVEEESPASLAPMLGTTPNGVSSRAKRAKERLRQAFLVQHLATAPTQECRDARRHFGAYVRDALSQRERDAVDEHLQDCDRCRAALLEITDTNNTMRVVIAPLLLGAPLLAQQYLAAASGAAASGAAPLGAAAAGAAGGGAATGGAASGRSWFSPNPAALGVAAAGLTVVVVAAGAVFVANRSDEAGVTTAAQSSAQQADSSGADGSGAGGSGSGAGGSGDSGSGAGGAAGAGDPNSAGSIPAGDSALGPSGSGSDGSSGGGGAGAGAGGTGAGRSGGAGGSGGLGNSGSTGDGSGSQGSAGAGNSSPSPTSTAIATGPTGPTVPVVVPTPTDTSTVPTTPTTTETTTPTTTRPTTPTTTEPTTTKPTTPATSTPTTTKTITVPGIELPGRLVTLRLQVEGPWTITAVRVGGEKSKNYVTLPGTTFSGDIPFGPLAITLTTTAAKDQQDGKLTGSLSVVGATVRISRTLP